MPRPQFSRSQFALWKKLQLGMGPRNPEELVEALEKAGRFGCWISDTAREMLRNPKFTITERPTETGLVRVSADALALDDDISFRSVVERAESFGLILCPAEAGPQLLLQHCERPAGDVLHIAMAPIEDARGYPLIFVLNGNVGLASSGGRPNNAYSRRDTFVFAARAAE